MIDRSNVSKAKTPYVKNVQEDVQNAEFQNHVKSKKQRKTEMISYEMIDLFDIMAM